MARAIALAIAQLFSAPILGVLGACVVASLACFAAMWFGVGWLFDHWLDDSTLATVFGGVTTLVLAWFLFPLVASSFVALLLDRVATVVERRHYPHLPVAKGLPIGQSILVSVRFLIVLIAANSLLLVLLFFPPVYAVAWFVVNGWLLGREYLELVALRRGSPTEATALRRRHGLECTGTGMMLAFLSTLPVVNLVLPVLATAVVVHRYQDWNDDADYSAGG